MTEQTEQTDDPTTFTFNWHEQRTFDDWEGFLVWSLVHLVVPTDENERTSWYDELSERTNNFANVELKILINGVEGNVQHLLEGIHANMVKYAREAAVEELRSSVEFRNMRHTMRALEGAIVDRAEQVARGFGLELRSDDD